MDAVNNVLNKMFQVAHTFGPSEWAVISLVTVVIGYMCLKTMKIR
ncbi:MAG: hypothetical protein ACR2NP_20765 [Pirellulaceae bacterium]